MFLQFFCHVLRGSLKLFIEPITVKKVKAQYIY